MKLNYSTSNMQRIERNETALAYHWAAMSDTSRAGYFSAFRDNGTHGAQNYLDQLQRERYDIRMPRFTVSRVDLTKLHSLMCKGIDPVAAYL